MAKITPHDSQRQASNPKISCWVSASAGTGKTKVLIDRLLNLLLAGALPESILCITYTKAAAIEMQNRLTAKLQDWVILDDSALASELLTLVGHQPSADLQAQARQLFFRVIDAAGGVRIQTIHSFCQSLLQRFPIEAAIDPSFTLLEQDEANALLEKAYHKALVLEDVSFQTALGKIASTISDYHFESLLESLQNQRGQFVKFLLHHQNLDNYKKILEDFLLDFVPVAPDTEALRKAACILKDQGDGRLEEWFDQDYSDFFLTKEGLIRKKLAPKEIQNKFPDVYKVLEEEALRLFNEKNHQKNQKVLENTLAFAQVAAIIFQFYGNEKQDQGFLDFEDLIAKTIDLLGRPGISDWVLYKLDHALDHILIDEAQDTSPNQWAVIAQIIESFLAPDKPHRTLFIVGDIKQSIYSFQGAQPLLFATLRPYFGGQIQALEQEWKTVHLRTSFRTTPAILEVVDKVFNADGTGVKFVEEEILHTSFRFDHPGIVELLPLIQEEEQDAKEEPWALPLIQKESISDYARLAKQITKKIQGLLHSDQILPTTNARVQPGDILILVRKRSALVSALVQNLKSAGIPIAGADRLHLKDHIAVMDLLALGQFLCLPQDDYSLACVLKSPLVNRGRGITEEQLFTLCHGRTGSLWQSLNQEGFEDTYEFLKTLLNQVDIVSPHSLFQKILRQTELFFVGRLGEECREVLEEFLHQAFLFEEKNSPTLQGFMDYMTDLETEIKRNTLGDVQNQVRMMTIHGAKGLEAPIVILADSTDQPSLRNEDFLWIDKEKAPLFLLKPSKKNESPLLLALKEETLVKFEEENRRLFYVALTRPRDRLYVAGIQKKRMDKTWYQILKDILGPISSLTPEGGMIYEPIPSLRGQEAESNLIPIPAMPEWVYEKPLSIPKDPVEIEEKTSAMKRGDLIHKLFELLPNCQGNIREIAENWIQTQKYKETLEEGDLDKVLFILDHPDYRSFFGPNSLAEVTIANKSFQKRIDRLLITDDTVVILDYKTAINPPISVEDVPKPYKDQLSEYANILGQIYKNHQIRTFLLWTEGPHLMEIPYNGFKQ